MSYTYYKDILFPDAVEIVLTSGVASAGRIQNNLQIGPNRAVRLIEEMEALGIIGPAQGNRPRAVLMSLDEWYESKHTFAHLEEPARPAAPTQATGASMYCRHCGKQLSVSSKFCDGCGKPTDGPVAEPKKKKKKGVILVVLAVLLVLFFLIGSFGNTDPDQPQNAGTSSPSTVATKAPPKINGIGDRLEMDDVYVTLNEVCESEGSALFQPADGNVFVVFDFTIENESDKELVVSSILNFKAYFDDFVSEYSLLAVSLDNSNMLIDNSVAPGKKIRGIVGYEAPKDWSRFEISYQPDLLSNTTFTYNHSR